MDMKTYIGVDGGGTKTAFALANETGEILVQIERTGCSYLEIGVPQVVSLLKEGIEECLNRVQLESCDSICIGLPCFGENLMVDELLRKQLKNALPASNVMLVNDAVVGWAGSLGGKEGIHLVAGTGSLAIGKGIKDHFARSGGWNEFFSDEGSCYWVAKEAMRLFSKQADGRLEKGPLYYLVKEKYQLKNDFEFIDHVLSMSVYRDQVASFQKIALQAADANDVSVQNLYEKAAEELAEMAVSVKNQLSWSQERVPVSYYGGLFHAKKWVLPKLKHCLQQHGCTLHEPIGTAVEGAVLMAIKSEKNT